MIKIKINAIELLNLSLMIFNNITICNMFSMRSIIYKFNKQVHKF